MVWGGGTSSWPASSCPAAEDALLEELARKARFSQHTLTEEERAAAWERLEALGRETANALPVWKRWLLRLLRPAV